MENACHSKGLIQGTQTIMYPVPWWRNPEGLRNVICNSGAEEKNKGLSGSGNVNQEDEV